MPYKIKKFEDGFKVCKKEGEKCFSKEPLSLEQAESQLKAIGINSHLNGGAKPINNELYEKIKKDIYKKYPKHSLFRSALLVKEYLNQGGKYEGKKNHMNIKKWFKQNWLSANDYLRGEKIPCGSSNTEEKFGEYPLCRPEAILKKMSKEELIKLVNEKNKLKKSHLITEDILGTDKYNIKSTMTGLGKKNFKTQLDKIGFKIDKYLEIAKKIAKSRGYDSSKLSLSSDGTHKLDYDGVGFGAIGYNDKIIYGFLEVNNKVPKGTTYTKMTNYRKRAKKVMEEANNKYSASSLSFYILW